VFILLLYHCYTTALKSWFACTFVTCCSINTQYSMSVGKCPTVLTAINNIKNNLSKLRTGCCINCLYLHETVMLSTVPCLHWRYLSVHCLDTLRLWLLSFQFCVWLYCTTYSVLNCEFLCIRGTSMALCLSVHLSVTSRSSTKTAKHRITQTTPHDSPETLVFWSQRSPRNSTVVTPYAGDKCR